jgi:hypothetical protein
MAVRREIEGAMHMQGKKLLLTLMGAIALGGFARAATPDMPKVPKVDTPKVPDVPKVESPRTSETVRESREQTTSVQSTDRTTGQPTRTETTRRQEVRKQREKSHDVTHEPQKKVKDTFKNLNPFK